MSADLIFLALIYNSIKTAFSIELLSITDNKRDAKKQINNHTTCRSSRKSKQETGKLDSNMVFFAYSGK